MTIYDVAGNKKRMAVFNTLLEEACRQWCDLSVDAPERKDGENFAEFFFEIFEAKEHEYIEEIL
ncbi:hypothetical protein EBB54_12745 [Schaedlerella arabinosiphila]|jgi:hypothetical protein|uniref:Uncharacterized protein n=1 Tax=Schaedlerella arabinosiphila TaxID=2044587 RepID=A0A3R8JN32_9FIRM|nr:hypothetical protein [Schaedlerella arabinosiphila]EOS40271.1 hypothetical protein C808_01242 [Lachnospiraceae bacterium M18-1]RRK32137.1 hypothetical protein EBB54_12745 [Schaedlerella arabinosiphila]